MTESDWKTKCINEGATVVGLGISNLPLIDFLLSHGIPVTARDRKTRAELGETAQALEAKGVRLNLGESYLDALSEGVIFRSPGIRPDHPALREAVSRGACLSSEMELFLSLTPAHVIGITGSDGKTTTTTVTGLLLEAACKVRGRGRVFVGGNIGEPLLPRLGQMCADDFAVVELSSFQLQTMRQSPARAAITNVTPNHLNWHVDMAEYTDAKTNIYRHTGNRLLVANAENDVTRALAKRYHGAVTLFSSHDGGLSRLLPELKEGDRAVYLSDGAITCFDGIRERRIVDISDILLPGKHNVENYMTAVALTDGLVSADCVRAVAKSFRGVAHRLELIRTFDGVRYYNSSIDSSPTRTAAALSALAEKPIVICGGYDKNIPFEPLAEVLLARARAVVLTGATAGKIARALRERTEATGVSIPILTESDFSEAVRLARRIARAGDTVLLSPACASFDAFRNFEERGNTFRAIVEAFA